jgi:hypothetical protein
MAKEAAQLLSFNRGEVSAAALARVDVEALQFAAETQVNWQPFVIGPMMLRPGMRFVGATNANAQARFLPFIFANSDLALLELTDSTLRVWNLVGDVETLVTRPSVTTTVTNGDFSSGTGWTLTQTGAGASATVSGGKLNLSSPTVGGIARGSRTVTVAPADQNVEHAFNITVDRGPITFRAGSSSGGDQYIEQSVLETGVHSLAFTPTGANVYIELETTTPQTKIVDSIQVASAGVMTLTTPWTVDDLQYVRPTQSGDIVYVACNGFQQRQIERRSTRSWSVVLYKANDGPFKSVNLTDTTLAPAALNGNTTLTASRALFTADHVGCLFRLFSVGQSVSASVGAENTFSDPIRVSGVGTDRAFSYSVGGTWTGTVTLQRSVTSATSGYTDVLDTTSNVATSLQDSFDNVIIWYRLGIKTGDYGSGTAVLDLAYAGGGNDGVGRVTGFTSSTVVDVEILSSFSSTDATADWNEGEWSDVSGWPDCTRFHDGRLFWAGRDKIWGSVSDNFTSFDINTEGDSAPINRSVGFGPVDSINWMLSLTRLIVGREGAETSIRSSSLDEPLTPTNFTLKDCSTQGSFAIDAVRIDTIGVFVQQSNRRVYRLAYLPQAADYGAFDLTRLNTDIGIPGFIEMAVQRQPDTQILAVLGDGTVAALLHDMQDEVLAWWRIETDGEIESVCVLPGDLEDRVYYSVKRSVNGSDVRYLERMALRSQCEGRPEARHADSHVIYSGTSTTSITGLAHLEGEEVVAWGWDDDDTSGTDLGTYTVAGGLITLSQAVENACVGLAYDAQFKSAKLAYAAQAGSALTQRKRVDRMGLILLNTHYQGIQFGADFEKMDNLPLTKDGATASAQVYAAYDEPMSGFRGNWNTDSRLCLKASAPKPCTVMAAVVGVQTHEG